MMDIAVSLAEAIGVREACEALGVPRSSFYRLSRPDDPTSVSEAPRPTPERALSKAERELVREVLNSPRFQDCSPRQVYAY